jgi:hypothetical protein
MAANGIRVRTPLFKSSIPNPPVVELPLPSASPALLRSTKTFIAQLLELEGLVEEATEEQVLAKKRYGETYQNAVLAVGPRFSIPQILGTV